MSDKIGFTPELGFEGWFAIIRDDGRPHCSCGRPLERIAKSVWRCSAGYPQYNLDDGDIFFDKFGSTYFKEKSHDPSEEPNE